MVIGYILFILVIMFVFAYSFELLWKDRKLNRESQNWNLDRFAEVSASCAASEMNIDDLYKKYTELHYEFMNEKVKANRKKRNLRRGKDGKFK